MSIGANVKHLRTEKEMSQEELAQAVGVSRAMIAQVERGTKSLTLALGKEIADVFGVPINELLEDGAADSGE